MERPILTGDFSDDVTSGPALRAFAADVGLSDRELVAPLGGGHSIGQMHGDRSGFVGAWSRQPTVLDNEYFANLLDESWQEYSSGNGSGNGNGNGSGNGSAVDTTQYTNSDKSLFMLKTDLELLWDPAFKAIAQEYASDPDALDEDFAAAWSRLIDLDRFQAPPKGACVLL